MFANLSPSPALVPSANPSSAKPSSKSGGIECRVHERKPCDVPSACQPASEFGRKESRWPARISNISLGGACLELRRRFEPGTGLVVELPGSDGQENYSVLAKVVHVKNQNDGSWALGCRFVSELSEDEMGRLLPKPEPKGQETKTLTKVNWQLQVRPGSVLRYHVKRLQVSANWPLVPGLRVTLRGGRWHLKAQILECSQDGDSWTVKARLLNTPSTEQLLAALSA